MNASRSVLITGAAGFVARSVARVLAAGGATVTGLDREALPVSANGAASSFAHFWQCDLRDDDALSKLARERSFDAVIHLAGLLPGKTSRTDLFAVNVGGTSAVLEHFGRPDSHVVLFSTGLVYGKQPGPFREDAACLATEPYGQSKLAAESLTQSWGRANGASVAVLRPSVLYGVGAPPAMLLVALMNSLRRNEPFAMTAGEQLRDFLHVDDAAIAVAKILESRAQGTWNLAYGRSHYVLEAAELAATLAERRNLLRIGELSYRPSEIFDYRLDNQALRDALGWEPSVTLREGLHRLWEETR